MSRVAVTGARLILKQSPPCRPSKLLPQSARYRPACGLVLQRLAVALVLFALPAVALKAQEPEQWPTDDDDSPSQAQSAPSQAQPPGAFDYPQPNTQPGDGQQSGYGQQPGYGQQQAYGAPPQPDPDYGQQPGNGQQSVQQLGYMPAQAMNAAQLEQLVAPIALYPDT